MQSLNETVARLCIDAASDCRSRYSDTMLGIKRSKGEQIPLKECHARCNVNVQEKVVGLI